MNPMHANTHIDDQDELLDAIEKGISTLGVLAVDLNDNNKIQSELVENLDKEIEETSGNIELMTNATNKLIKNSGGKVRFCLIILMSAIVIILILVLVFI